MPSLVCPASQLSLKLLLLAVVVTSGWPVSASDAEHELNPAQQQAGEQKPPPDREQSDNPDSKRAQEPALAAVPTTQNLCEALSAAAVANDLPVDFFTRLIWQESRFKPDAISSKGAQGIAQFMPATARSSRLQNPFDPLEAIAKSGQLLRDLRREFGNLGLAAAAYNAGSGRVHDWLGSHRRLPQETRAYVRIVTGRSAEEWATGSQVDPLTISPIKVPCDLPVTALMAPTAESARPKPEMGKSPEPVKPWGVEIVGGTTPENALRRYHDWQPKYAAIVAGREPHIVIRGVIGQAGAARVRVGEDTRNQAERLCALLKAAGTYCDVLRN